MEFLFDIYQVMGELFDDPIKLQEKLDSLLISTQNRRQELTFKNSKLDVGMS